MQTILGAGGVIGVELANTLPAFTNKIRLVSRNPQKMNATDELFAADLLNKAEVDKAIEGSEIVYLVAGLTYNLKIWQQQWPIIMQNVIDGCKKHKAKLVFFDNIYMLDKEALSNITEDSPINPSSKKGEIRARLITMIWDEMKAGNLQALIARAADFYGPKITTSMLQETVYKNFLKGKPANWFCTTDKLHSFTYTPDAGKATAMLGNDPKAYGQVWNLPTAAPLTGKQWIEAFAREMNVKPKIQLVPKWMARIMGWFMPIMKEFIEMLYQFDRDYVFNSSHFEEQYKFTPTPVETAIKEIIAADKSA